MCSNDYIVEQLSGEVARWSSQCINNTAITSYQKENNITAYEEHAGVPSSLVTETIFTWGSLAYGFIPKDHRQHKLSGRAFMGVWVGLDKRVYAARRVVPIVEVDGKWECMPTMVCVKVKVFEGVFPLTLVPDNNMPKPTTIPRKHLLTQRDLEDEDYKEQSELVEDYDRDEDDDGGNYEIKKIMEHDHGDYPDKTKYK